MMGDWGSFFSLRCFFSGSLRFEFWPWDKVTVSLAYFLWQNMGN